ncbi:ADC synthase [Tricladium varicosporioides]|nr:ADC synthase [Hymenoscyphus varicosporioides]
MTTGESLILFIDAYDSFSNNIISLLETTLHAPVRTIKIDDPAFNTDEALHKELRHYDAVVCGPGPGHPGKERDVGIIRRIWRLCNEELLPVLGICLGFQSLCLEFGGKVRRLNGPQHGMIRRVTHIGETELEGQESIFTGVGEIHATLYQSLCVDLGQDTISNYDWPDQKWKPFKKTQDLLPLAWVESGIVKHGYSDSKDDRVMVAVRHTTKPFWALQYHPESICTNKESEKVIENWFNKARTWNQNSRHRPKDRGESTNSRAATRESLLYASEKLRPMLNGSADFPHNRLADDRRENVITLGDTIYYYRILDCPGPISAQDIVDELHISHRDQIILESSNAYVQSTGSADVRGRYSIIAYGVHKNMRFEYRAGSDKITCVLPKGHDGKPVSCDTDLRPFGGVWQFIAQYLDKTRLKTGIEDSPFWGGFMGYTTYELGLEGIDVQCRESSKTSSRPDLCFVWVTRSIVIDHRKNKIYLQHLAPRDDGEIANTWLCHMIDKLDPLLHPHSPIGTHPSPRLSPFKSNPIFSPNTIKVSRPGNAIYEEKVLLCQESILSGDSYELCLTDQTRLTTPHASHAETWQIYKSLRARQPAPFASFIRLGGATLISSSPERFLTWDAQGKCSLRPMKGTVSKSKEVDTLAKATVLLDVPKEKAENLMIVDLVRHDLHGVCGSGAISVPRLMVVEEYASVFQMISIVEGQIPRPFASWNEENKLDVVQMERRMRERYTGIDILSASLPPGSMTGAPKKRSCEILQEIEQGQERSLYSGVVGYMDIGGRGDWSVTIRSLFRWDDECETIDEGSGLESKTDTWNIGAGGAVTALSTPEGEREEMNVKLRGTLGVFGV